MTKGEHVALMGWSANPFLCAGWPSVSPNDPRTYAPPFGIPSGF
jgi:hypothetical protein